jgi:hypothetical protein
MSSQINLITSGTVIVEGTTYTTPTTIPYDQLTNNKDVDVALSSGATCELHRAGVSIYSTLCLRLVAGNGVFKVIKVKARPKLRKSGKEFDDDEMRRCKRNVKVHNNRRKVTYTIKKTKGLLVDDRKIRFDFTV